MRHRPAIKVFWNTSGGRIRATRAESPSKAPALQAAVVAAERAEVEAEAAVDEAPAADAVAVSANLRGEREGLVGRRQQAESGSRCAGYACHPMVFGMCMPSQP